MRRSWLAAAATTAVGAAAIAVGAAALGGPASADANSSAAAHTSGVRLAPAPALPQVRAHTALAATGPTSIYMKVAGVPGEATGQYAGQIDTFSFSWGVSNPPSLGSGGAGKASLSDLNVQQAFDRSVPLLESMAESGRVIPSAVLTVAQGSSGNMTAFMRIALANVRVDSVSVGGAAGGGRPSVSVSYSYGQEETDYFYNGTISRSCWDVTTNSASCPPAAG